MSTTQSGRCLCGAVTFAATDVDPHLHACHCSICRRWNGGPALAIDVGSVTFQGAEHIEHYASSDWAERGFCKRCGSNLFYLLKPDRHILWAGAFDQQDFVLNQEIFMDAKPEGYSFSGEHARFGALPEQ